MNDKIKKPKTKLEKLQEKFMNEKSEYKKNQLLIKIRKLQPNVVWDSSLKKTYRKGEKNV